MSEDNHPKEVEEKLEEEEEEEENEEVQKQGAYDGNLVIEGKRIKKKVDVLKVVEVKKVLHFKFSKCPSLYTILTVSCFQTWRILLFLKEVVHA
jgi:hypothetical protein